MNPTQRLALANDLQQRLDGDDANPVLILIKTAALYTVSALLACCDQYLCIEWRLKARSLAATPVAVGGLLQDVSAALRHTPPSLDRCWHRRAQLAAMLMAILERDVVSPTVEQLLFEYLLSLHIGEHEVLPTKETASICWPKKPIDEILRFYGLGAHHSFESAVLDSPQSRESVLDFLEGSAVMARTLCADQLKGSLEELMAIFLRLHVDGDVLDEMSDEFGKVADPNVVWAATEVLNSERMGIADRTFPFPEIYRDAFGDLDGGAGAGLPREHHSYFASRVVAGACLFNWYRECWDSARALNANVSATDFIDSILHGVWDHGTIDAALGPRYGRSRGDKDLDESRAAVPEEFHAGSFEVCAWGVVERLHREKRLTREYDVARQWKSSLGVHGSFGNRANELMSVSADDHRTLGAVFESLANHERFGDSALVALAAKLGCFYRRLHEPLCNRPAPTSSTTKHLNAAAQQIDVIGQLVAAVRSVSDRGQARLVSMTERIYYKDSGRKDLQDGFQWNHTVTHWAEQRSDGAQKGPHLWLYGTNFQEEVDRLIAEMSTVSPVGTEGWARLARFIFLVPFAKGRHRLADWKVKPGWPQTIEGQLKLALTLLCSKGRHPRFDVYEHLACPILGIEVAGQDAILFAPPA